MTRTTRTLAATIAAVGIACTMATAPAAARDGRHAAFALGALGGLALGAIAAGAAEQAPAPYAPEPAYGYGPAPYAPAYAEPSYGGSCWTERQPVYSHLGVVKRYEKVRVCN